MTKKPPRDNNDNGEKEKPFGIVAVYSEKTRYFFSSFFVHVEVKTVSLSKQNTVGIVVLRPLQVVSAVTGRPSADSRALQRFIFLTTVKTKLSFHRVRFLLCVRTSRHASDSDGERGTLPRTISRVPFELLNGRSERTVVKIPSSSYTRNPRRSIRTRRRQRARAQKSAADNRNDVFVDARDVTNVFVRY